MPDLSNFLPVLSIVVSICVVIGGFIAFRSGYASTTADVQDKVITALKIQIEALEKQVDTSAKEITKLKRVMITIQSVLTQRGLHITVDDETITLREDASKQTTTTIQITSSQQTTP